MTDPLRPASLETAFGNARALCREMEAEAVSPAFDAAMDVACRLNELFLLRSPVKSGVAGRAA
ncbi:hypothetical protein [Azospirillum halopraeferens]|uniref:hypothetical protein n=1 Tax=Azospirillum halopraeferens TaxID=34010 RepID=UPI0004148985|nr:hypothetical protein [Azospirillum halopraeferens]